MKMTGRSGRSLVMRLRQIRPEATAAEGDVGEQQIHGARIGDEDGERVIGRRRVDHAVTAVLPEGDGWSGARPAGPRRAARARPRAAWLAIGRRPVGGRHEGRWTRNSAPAPGSLVTAMRPPCCVTAPKTVARPMPDASPRFLVVKNGSKMCGRSSGAMPTPVSRTRRSTSSALVLLNVDRERAPGRHRVARVEAQVHDDLAEHAAVAAHERRLE